ncbi:hypothetical protein [Iodobacter fluviatilis]|uniref:Uncharacterized protein n=1 Tax=Iodobacter fluviatilis TaxID=537 RepID=A0A377Q437_9NEIS|nr:hypothetical protein [Iodobacter fluviatilis]TCU90322.1 hypothetical protein EV682_101348 [Iodobacter fluviatilis]STQ89349.1 Uncharacterised protein [Iodobacter fluviatilis]
MHTTLVALSDELKSHISTLDQYILNEGPFTVAYGWNCPSISKGDLHDVIHVAINRIEQFDGKLSSDTTIVIEQLTAKLVALRTHTFPQFPSGNYPAVLQSYVLSLLHIEQLLRAALPDPSVAECANYVLKAQELRNKLKGLESRINKLDPSTQDLEHMVARIRAADETATRLPADLDELRQAKQEITRLQNESNQHYQTMLQEGGHHRRSLDDKLNACLAIKEMMDQQSVESQTLLKQLRELHRIGTSTVLAGAFQQRANSLGNSVYAWLFILLCALLGAMYVGHERAQLISTLLQDPKIPALNILIQTLLMVLSIGPAVWLSWVATKQISQRFKLAEDYSFKASIGNAYEGYRKEAVDLDDDFRRKLFTSTLNRLDEQPLRVMEIENHGSPVQEAAKSSGFWDFMKHVAGNRNSLNSETSSHSVPQYLPESEKKITNAANE